MPLCLEALLATLAFHRTKLFLQTRFVWWTCKKSSTKCRPPFANSLTPDGDWAYGYGLDTIGFDCRARQTNCLSLQHLCCLQHCCLLPQSTSGTDSSISVALSRGDSSDCTVADSTVDSGLSVTSDGANSLSLTIQTDPQAKSQPPWNH